MHENPTPRQLRNYLAAAANLRAIRVVNAFEWFLDSPGRRETHFLSTSIRRFLAADFCVKPLYDRRLLGSRPMKMFSATVIPGNGNSS